MKPDFRSNDSSERFGLCDVRPRELPWPGHSGYGTAQGVDQKFPNPQLTLTVAGAIRPPVGWAAVIGAGAVAGIGFIVSLLIASLAFHGSQLAEAKAGVLSAALCASVLGWAVFRLTATAAGTAAAARAARHRRDHH